MLAKGGGPRVFLAGVNHFDPLGLERLVERLGRLAGSGVRPQFIAVEYDAQHFSKIVNEQRSKFRRLLLQEWPDLDDAELDLLERSLCYDGDAHRAVFPEAEVVWLDQGREVPPDVLETLAGDTVAMYRNCWRSGLHGRIHELSAAVTAQEECRSADQRDRAFAKKLLEALDRHRIGLAIVGRGHVDLGLQDSMAHRLSRHGVDCVCV